MPTNSRMPIVHPSPFFGPLGLQTLSLLLLSIYISYIYRERLKGAKQGCQWPPCSSRVPRVPRAKGGHLRARTHTQNFLEQWRGPTEPDLTPLIRRYAAETRSPLLVKGLPLIHQPEEVS